MESIRRHNLLQLPTGVVENIRKIHGLDKPGRLEQAINILQAWLQKQDHIIKKDFSRDYLERTLIFCKGSVEKSKKQIDRLCSQKTLIPKFFAKTNLKEELKGALELIRIVPLPILTKDYYRIFTIQNTGKTITSEILMEYYQYAVILCEYMKANEYANGVILIWDCTKMNLLDYLAIINTEDIQHAFSIFIDGFGARLKSMHVVSESKTIDLLIRTIKKLVSEKIEDRFSVHSTLENLRKAVPVEWLPLEYGGKQRSILQLQNEWIEELSSEKHVEYMKMMNKACTDESRRAKAIFNEHYMGMPGSFRNLSVD